LATEIVASVVNACGADGVCTDWCWGAPIWEADTWSGDGVAAPLIGLAVRLADGLLYVYIGYLLTMLMRCATVPCAATNADAT
jgi:hypothetical protein